MQYSAVSAYSESAMLPPYSAVKRMFTSLTLLTQEVILSSHVCSAYVTQEDAESLPIRVPSVFLIRGH